MLILAKGRIDLKLFSFFVCFKNDRIAICICKYWEGWGKEDKGFGIGWRSIAEKTYYYMNRILLIIVLLATVLSTVKQ